MRFPRTSESSALAIYSFLGLIIGVLSGERKVLKKNQVSIGSRGEEILPRSVVLMKSLFVVQWLTKQDKTTGTYERRRPNREEDLIGVKRLVTR